MNRRFEQLVEEALEDLPPEFAERLDNIVIAVQDLASSEQLAKVNLRNPHHLLGLYEGIPLTDRPQAYAGALPDRISIFRIPIEEMSRPMMKPSRSRSARLSCTNWGIISGCPRRS